MNRDNTYLIGNQFAKGNLPNKTSFKKGIYQGFGFKKENQYWKNRPNWKPPMLGKIFTIKHRENISKGLKGKINGKANAIKGRDKISQSKIGYKNPNWKGGITPLNIIIRRSRFYKQWAKRIFERDDFICQKCKRKGGRLEAHHIKPFSIYIKLRFDDNNAVTLCKNCHKETDNYGRPKQKR